MGASLLAKAVCHSTLMVNVMAPSRASPLPQGIFGAHTIYVSPQTLWERGLPAMGATRSY
ncbi:hypothetical protein EI534_18270 [Pseudomonas frederiksbergensis]|nr:hypothetical protein [Pseudomonas frederiksbergensis]